jgi:nicotinate-nucleotide--dimethylbenzimidazole phosphoribosyltransferase
MPTRTGTMHPNLAAVIPPLDEQARAQAKARHLQLTKPTGALGQLETLSTDLAAMQGTALPQCERVAVLIFAGDHGVAALGVSAYPQAVTAHMCLNFIRGGAAVNVLARQAGATLTIIDVGVCQALPPSEGLVLAKIAAGTADFTSTSAMTSEQTVQAMQVGHRQAMVAIAAGAQVLVCGEMGIGNTTSASALMSAYSKIPSAQCCGRGTGINDETLARKRQVVEAGLQRHHAIMGDPQAVLAALGGFEIAALVGAMLAAAQQRVALVVEGFICSVASLTAKQLNPSVRGYLIWAHRSAEAPHTLLLDYVQERH